MLGLSLKNTGISTHVKERVRTAKYALKKLKRFSNCPENIKIQLYKTLVRPILEYPPVPLNTISTTLMWSMQAVQNIALIWATGIRYPDPRPPIRELHTRHKLEALNVRIHRLAGRVWERLEMQEDINYLRIIECEAEGEHNWWPRSLPRALQDPPQPKYSRYELHRPNQM